MLSGNFRTSRYGAHCFVVMIDLKHLEKDFNRIRHYTEEFPYWRYFEDSSIVMQNNMKPVIKTMAPAAVSLVRTVQGQAQKVMENMPLRRQDQVTNRELR